MWLGLLRLTLERGIFQNNISLNIYTHSKGAQCFTICSSIVQSKYRALQIRAVY